MSAIRKNPFVTTNAQTIPEDMDEIDAFCPTNSSLK